MTSPAEAVVPPERPDFASERPQPEAESPPRDGPDVPNGTGPSGGEGVLEDVVERDHPLS